jgi:hypothetical protein
MNDPLQLCGKPTANDIRLARTAPHLDVERLYARITSGQFPSSILIAARHRLRLVDVGIDDVLAAVASGPESSTRASKSTLCPSSRLTCGPRT